MIGLILLSGVITCAFIKASASLQPAAWRDHKHALEGSYLSRPASVIYAYYAAVNDADWPKAWELAGQSAAVYSAAYNHRVSRYSCTVRDQIAASRLALLVSVRTQESGGVIRTYRLS